MEVNYNKLNEIEFANLDFPILFNDNLYSKCYGTLFSNLLGFKFGWRSELLDPIVQQIDENIYTIGIDQNFTIIDFNNNTVGLNMNLLYNFHDLLNSKTHIAICTELEVILVNKLKYNIDQIIELPDFFEEGRIEEGRIIITCTNQNVIENYINS